jgi:sugar lactone lactonase YvrE
MSFSAPAEHRISLSLAKHSQVLRLCLVGLLAGLLAACGGGGDSSSDDDDELIAAFNVVGQLDFTGANANRGGGVSGNGLSQPLGAIGSDGTHLFVADTANNRVLAFNPTPAALDAAATFVLGQPDFIANVPGTSASIFALPSTAFVGGGRLVVADSGNNRVLIWNTVPTAATAPDVVVGQADFNSNVSGTSASTLSYPTSAIIANGRLVVADQNNNRVLVWNTVPTTNGTAASLVLGQTTFLTNTSDDEADEMNRPSALWSDGFRLLICDSGNNRVLYWQLFPQTSGTFADYVLGQSSFSRSAAGTSSSAMRAPFGVASDGTGVYVADSGNNRVLKFNTFPIENGRAASEVYGQLNFASTVPNDDDQDGEVDDTPSDSTLSGASGVWAVNGVLYVTDRNNHRILFFPQ